jgi:hypothetical protein
MSNLERPMLKFLPCALALTLAATGAVRADDAIFGGFAEIAATGEFPSDNPPPLPPNSVNILKAGPLQVILETTPLTDVQKAFGGTIHNQGEAGDHVVWLCYGAGSQTLWFYSDGEMGDGKVTLAAMEKGVPEVKWGCSLAPASLENIDFGVPGIGAKLDDVTKRLGASPADENGRFAYTSDTPLENGSEFTKFQELVFEAHSGVITAIAATQATSD